MKKLITILAILFCSFMFFSSVQIIRAADPSTPPSVDYKTLSPITAPGGDTMDIVKTNNFPAYLQAIYKIGIGACFVLGVIMFTWAGIEYIVSEAMGTKADAIKRIQASLIGLAIVLVSYILLYTINPSLVILQNLDVSPATTTK